MVCKGKEGEGERREQRRDTDRKHEKPRPPHQEGGRARKSRRF